MSAEFVAAHKAKKDSEASKTNPIPGLVIQETKKKEKNENKGVTSITENIAMTSILEKPSRKKSNNSNQKPNTLNDKLKVSNVVPGVPIKQAAAVDPLKKLKNLNKISEIKSLDKKIKSGEIKNPDKEMLGKVERKYEIKREIDILEVNQ